MPILHFASILAAIGAGVVGAGVQRMAWEASQKKGLFMTVSLILCGVLLHLTMNEALLQYIGIGAWASGTVIVGWVATEKWVIVPVSRRAIEKNNMRLEEERVRRRRTLEVPVGTPLDI